MAAGFVLNVVLNEAHNICVIPGFCQRVRFRKSNCQRCLEICPENAISLNPGPAINSGCTDCGLCLNACPTEVFRHEFHTDRYLLNQARAIFGKDRHQPQAEKKRAAADSGRYRELQLKFLDEHLNAWFPHLSRSIQANAKSNFYRGLARITEAFLAYDTSGLLGA